MSLGVHGNVLFIDGNFSCYQWWQYLLGTFIIVFAVPFTVLLAWGSVKLFSGTVTIRGLVLGCIFPLPVLLYWLFSFLCYSAVQYNEHDEALAVKRALYGPFREPKDGKKGTVYWESILIARRLVLIVLHTFVIDMHARFLIMSFVCMIILCIHLIVQPFRRNSANILESCSLLSLVVIATINTYKASFISVGVEPSGPTSEVVGYLSQWIRSCASWNCSSWFSCSCVFICIISNCARSLLLLQFSLRLYILLYKVKRGTEAFDC